jgi:hypothetical protein
VIWPFSCAVAGPLYSVCEYSESRTRLTVCDKKMKCDPSPTDIMIVPFGGLHVSTGINPHSGCSHTARPVLNLVLQYILWRRYGTRAITVYVSFHQDLIRTPPPPVLPRHKMRNVGDISLKLDYCTFVVAMFARK